MGVITNAHVERGISYDDYRKLIDDKFAIGQTTGIDHSESMLNYTKLNIQRMNKWDKVTKLGDEIVSLAEKLDRPQYWMLLTEGWCGDAAQCLPLINKVASLNDKIKLEIILRDENPEVMDAYLTDGGRSIPKLIILDAETLEEIHVWGPRPEPAQQMLRDHKANPGVMTGAEFATKLHTWYAKDRGKTLEMEFTQILNSIQSFHVG